MTDRLTPEQIRQLLTLAEQATPGPWTSDDGCSHGHGGASVFEARPGGSEIAVSTSFSVPAPPEIGQDDRNTRYLAAANPAVIRALCQMALEGETLRAELARAEGEMFECPKCAYGCNTLNHGNLCPNDGTPLRRQTWKDRAMTASAKVADLERRAAQAEATATELRVSNRRLLEAVCALWDDPEDCDDCESIDVLHGSGRLCALHTSERLYKAMTEAREQLGPCRCGHRASEHHDEDTTRCGVCDCAGFRLPEVNS